MSENIPKREICGSKYYVWWALNMFSLGSYFEICVAYGFFGSTAALEPNKNIGCTHLKHNKNICYRYKELNKEPFLDQNFYICHLKRKTTKTIKTARFFFYNSIHLF